ncbi:MAG: amidohydrolase family protein [Clostridia bacterium]|nr:amidohydrolase family protein [Clostridia bacterium]
MAFGFFRKNESADLIIRGGTICTLDADLPYAEAVACKDGIIIGVGDEEDIAEFEGKATEIIDLEGSFLVPGFIDTCGHPVSRCFSGMGNILSDPFDLDTVLGEITTYVDAHPEEEYYFFRGYDEVILKDKTTEETRALLDEITDEKPVVVMGESGVHCWFNTYMLDMAKAAAEEEEMPVITLSYLISLIEPFDYDELRRNVIEIAKDYCSRGFTSVFDCGSPDFFDSVYQEILMGMFNEDMSKQRYFGALLVNRDFNPAAITYKLSQKRTACMELDGIFNFNTLTVVLDETSKGSRISQESAEKIIAEAAERGFDIYVEAKGEDMVFEALADLRNLRNAGCKKNIFTIAYDGEIETDEDLDFEEDIFETVSTLDKDKDFAVLDSAGSVEEAVDLLTSAAAIQLGAFDRLGSIEKGKCADFAVFKTNPLEAPGVAALRNTEAEMTIMNGRVVYDKEEDEASKWYAMMASGIC